MSMAPPRQRFLTPCVLLLASATRTLAWSGAAIPSPGCGKVPLVDPKLSVGQYLDLEVDGWARGVLLRLPRFLHVVILQLTFQLTFPHF